MWYELLCGSSLIKIILQYIKFITYEKISYMSPQSKL
jgi:hypothetical protein